MDTLNTKVPQKLSEKLLHHTSPSTQALYSLDIGLVVDDEEGVDLGEDFIVDGDAIQVLLEQRSQLRVLCHQRLLLFVQCQLLQENLVVALPEILQCCVLMHYLWGEEVE